MRTNPNANTWEEVIKKMEQASLKLEFSYYRKLSKYGIFGKNNAKSDILIVKWPSNSNKTHPQAY